MPLNPDPGSTRSLVMLSVEDCAGKLRVRGRRGLGSMHFVMFGIISEEEACSGFHSELPILLGFVDEMTDVKKSGFGGL